MERKNNKTIGNEFEDDFDKIMFANGYTVYTMYPNQKDGSQPFDKIAAKDNKLYMFDCKTCKSNIFKLSRVESNQMTAFNLAMSRGNTNCYFVFKTPGGITLTHASAVIGQKEDKIKQIDVSQFEPIDRWVSNFWR
jgi:Holliday junction resolvase